MKDEALVRIYTRPLFDLAVESQSAEATSAEVRILSDLFQQVPLLGEYLDSPSVTRSAKLELLRKAYDRPWSEYFGRFLNLVMRKGRQEIFPHVAEAFEHFWDEYRNRVDVQVTSAVELSESQKQAIMQRLAQRTGKTVELHCNLDPEIVGGLRVQIGHELLDATITGRLKALKEELLRQ